MKIKREETGQRKGDGICYHFFKRLVLVYTSSWNTLWLVGFDRLYQHFSMRAVSVSQRDGVQRPRAWNRGIQDNSYVQRTYLRDFLHIAALRQEQQTCLENLLLGKDVFATCRPALAKAWYFSCIHVWKDSHYLSKNKLDSIKELKIIA